MLERVSIRVGDRVELTVRDGKIVIEPNKSSLESLLARISP
ncbi:MAG: AbrB/MazE/SpoVT family DNA-binding domain-containing protein [Cyanobacteria bacterium J06639_1]